LGNKKARKKLKILLKTIFKKKQNHIDPQFLLTLQSLFLVNQFGFYFVAIR
jgi:hypothetical protein